MSLLFNMLSRLVITFLPSNKRLLISWLHSPSAVILEPQKIKSATVSTISPSICHEVMGLIKKNHSSYLEPELFKMNKIYLSVSIHTYTETREMWKLTKTLKQLWWKGFSEQLWVWVKQMKRKRLSYEIGNLNKVFRTEYGTTDCFQ